MLNNYEWFKAEILKMTKIDLNFYKEKQMRRRIDTLVTKNGAKFSIIIFSPFGFVIVGKGHQGLFYPIPFSYSCLIRDKGQIRHLCGSIQKYS